MIQNPTTAQKALINAINATALNFGKFEIEAHPLIPTCKRYLVVNKVIIDFRLPRVYIDYFQELEDEAGEIMPNNLPTPAWEILEDSKSTIRDMKTGEPIQIALIDENNQPILNEDGTAKTEVLELNTAKYMKFIENKGLTLTKIIGNYLPEFYAKHKEELNKLG